MTKDINPFIISGYAGAEYFCDREAERTRLITELVNGNNVTLFSPRRVGKTSLIEHCFHSGELERYHTFFIDIYATKNLRELVYAMSKTILNSLKSRGQNAFASFVKYVSS
ncbi:MAG: ATPase, partial [Bacteroidales bacterium]|nr:ATPase [Bacteroidales bacterium]